MSAPEAPTVRIMQAIREADRKLVERSPILGRDNLVAGAFFWGSLVLWASLALAWAQGLIPSIVTIPLIALCLSTLHELEHDLIHELYFRKGRRSDLALFVIWLAKCSLDPWSRGRIHRYHHVVSGQAEDVEERLIGLGEPWGPRRVALTLLPAASTLMIPSIGRALRARKQAGLSILDLSSPRWFKAFRAVNLLFGILPLPVLIAAALDLPGARTLTVLWILPNLLRHAAIVIMSSNSHYTEIPRHSLLHQNQILEHALFWPLQVFCWNFGATHVLHHLVVKQPFWRRTLCFGQVRQVLIENGIRHNDIGTFVRANTYPDTRPEPPHVPA